MTIFNGAALNAQVSAAGLELLASELNAAKGKDVSAYIVARKRS
ncbi:hypothetical protein ABWH93_12640 [Seohaeicola saemankumensis]